MKLLDIMGDNNKRIYKIVLTGGPCGGKTTGEYFIEMILNLKALLHPLPKVFIFP